MFYNYLDRSNERIDRYLDVAEVALRNSIGSEEYWPLNPLQLTEYFSDTFAVDIFTLVEELIEKHINPKKSHKHFPSPLSIRNFLINHGATGLKTAHNLGWYKTSFKQREEFFNYLFDVLEEKSGNDIFLESGKQEILSQEELDEMLSNQFIDLDGSSKPAYVGLKLSLFSLVWAYYFDLFASTGSITHGLYSFHDKVLMVYDYYDLCPVEIWPSARKSPLHSARLCAVYEEDVDLAINFFGREDSISGHNDKLELCFLEINGSPIGIEDAEDLSNRIFGATSMQTKYVREMKPLDVVKNGALISYYEFRDIFKFLKRDWHPPKDIDKVIEKFGDKFIVDFKEDEPIQNIKKTFDPRNNEIL